MKVPRVDRPNQVWFSDITSLPMRRGFLNLVEVMDWHTLKVLAWRIPNTLEADFCIEALNETIHKFGPPEIMTTDQGSQFTSFAWADQCPNAATLPSRGVSIWSLFRSALLRIDGPVLCQVGYLESILGIDLSLN